ncbi:OLC1v1011670C1 [Oldenlandia corymbosa var. corymbosa]|uniref:OLC1v1011670C1 n=1 Tax=Oldenlandia corymbosa var. corymbosa TaxID=529605 RepID=A0AAV1DXM1_OLDCO|nr:OLC1v1011670C1 [Oldenlandia corymbosa var. corymbosa]
MADDKKVNEEAAQILGLFQNLPRLVVFDLDYTLWPFYCECYYESDTPYLYPHARGIIDALKDRGIEMAIASRSPAREIATTFLEKLGIRSIFVAEEIFSSWTHKTQHFQKIHKKTGIPFESMLFFDDEDRNIEAVSKMGVTSVLVYDGVTLEALRQGLSDFSQVSSSNGRKKTK